MRVGSAICLALAAVAGCGGEDDPPAPLCNASAVASALLGARSGQTVTLGACTIEGAFVVPAGVGLAGAGIEQTRIVGPVGGVAIDLLPGLDAATTLTDLTIETPGVVGVRGDGPGHVIVERVTVEASAGAALGMVAVTEVELRDVTLVGPVTADNADDAVFLAVAPTTELPDPPSCSGEASCEPGALQTVPCPGCGEVQQACNDCGDWVTVTAAYGLALEAVTTATLDNVDVRGFASFAVVLRDTGDEGATAAGDITWSGGTIGDNLGVGLYAEGDLAVDLDGVAIDGTLSGLRGVPSYGGIVADGVALTTTGLALRDNDRYGLVQLLATAQHADLEATGNGDAALWVGESDGFAIDGGTLRGNTFAGIVVVGSAGVSLADVDVRETAEAPRLIGFWGSVQIGDGIQLTATTERVALTHVVLADNARVGLLVDFGDLESSPLDLADVTVSAEGEANGALAGAGDPDTQVFTPGGPDGWDDAIVREGATAANDQAAVDGLQYVGVPTPEERLPLPGIVTPCD